MKNILILYILFFSCNNLYSQFTDRYWTFGDYAGINFSNLSNPLSDTSGLRVRGSCASICDSSGNLLFYTATPDDSVIVLLNQFQQGYVRNKVHGKMSNSDSIKTAGWYQEMTIVPDPGNSNRFYVFHSGITTTPIPGFYYSVVDLSYNNGLGYVVQKNVRLENFPVCDGLVAVKHGNGRDWWVVIKQWDPNAFHDEFYFYLISPSGITKMPVQHIGSSIYGGGFTRLKFDKYGGYLYAIQNANLIERYDFDRCNGILSNSFTINQFNPSSVPNRNYWSHAISPNGSKLYISTIYNGNNSDTSYLLQYDLDAANILASEDTLYTFIRQSAPNPRTVAGLLQLGPDGKIYLSTSVENSDCGFQWLYCDTSTFFTENMNLSVINHPDSLGAACDFQPWSFYLGGHRTYQGLPNNPNYEIGKLVGSPCDTLGTVGVTENTKPQSELFVFYDREWQKAFINAKGLTGKNYYLQVIDISGKIVYQQKGSTLNCFFTKDLTMQSFANGMYIISLQTEKELLTSKMVKD
jgi:hypothetical protein